MTSVRLQKFLADAGVAARRKGELMITEGRVKVNGKVVTTLGTKIDANKDMVEVDGEGVAALDHFYVLLNKPKACIAAVSDDRGRPTVMDFLLGVPAPVRPVGRLDFYTEGVLLLTNDGELAARLLAPANHVPKTYHVKIHGTMREDEIKALRNGVRLDDGSVTMPAEVNVLPAESKHTWLAITLHEGKNRQIHRMIESLGHFVDKLQRVAFATLSFHGLRVGDARELTQQELNELLDVVGLPRGAVSRGRWRTSREETDIPRRARQKMRDEAEEAAVEAADAASVAAARKAREEDGDEDEDEGGEDGAENGAGLQASGFRPRQEGAADSRPRGRSDDRAPRSASNDRAPRSASNDRGRSDDRSSPRGRSDDRRGPAPRGASSDRGGPRGRSDDRRGPAPRGASSDRGGPRGRSDDRRGPAPRGGSSDRGGARGRTDDRRGPAPRGASSDRSGPRGRTDDRRGPAPRGRSDDRRGPAPRGASSERGPRGASSERGPRGASSERGPRGASSERGPRGASSERGPRGASSERRGPSDKRPPREPRDGQATGHRRSFGQRGSKR